MPVGLPTVDVHTVSAGGGSIARLDAGGVLRAGPESAGARPGPAAYGLGGTEAAVTDANVALGYLADGAVLGGEVRLQRALAEAALEPIARGLGGDVAAAAAGVVAVANAEMARALRRISVERGLDPRDFALLAFGGAGPLHACALAEELGMRTVLVPRESGVLSALGLAFSDERRDHAAPAPADGDLLRALAALAERAESELPGAAVERSADVRYRGQSFELEVPADDLDALPERFHAAHERRYGYRQDDEPVEVVQLRVAATRSSPRPALAEGPPRDDGVTGRRRIVVEGVAVDAPVLDRRRLGAGSELRGPAIVELDGATCLVAPGWAGGIDAAGTLVLAREGA